MKRIICLLLILCLPAACSLAGAEDQPSRGKPYTNPNLYDSFPECPGPEENYIIYADYDDFVKAAGGSDKWNNGFEQRSTHYVAQEIVDICLNSEYTDTESEIIRILYNLAADTEKLDREGIAPLMAKVDRVKAVRTLDELTALIAEKGFLLSTPMLYCIATEDSNQGLFLVSISKNPLLDSLAMTDEEIEANGGPLPDMETPRKRLVEMQYSEEEADSLVKEIERYDNDYTEDPEGWPEGRQLISLKKIRENWQPLYRILEGTGLVMEDNETKYRNNWDDPLSILYKRISGPAVVPATQAYITHCCPEEKWEKVKRLFEEIRQAMRARIEASTWLSEGSKGKCLEKIDDLILQPIVPPGGSFDCEPLLAALQGCESLADAAGKCMWFSNQCMMRFAGEPDGRENVYIYSMGGPLQTSGGYLPTNNMFSLGAAALCESVCDFSSRETLLGTIGMNMSHEIAHGYDFQNIRTDSAGTAPMITDEEYQSVAEFMKSFIGQLNRIETGNGHYMNGEATCIEAFADVQGMRLVLDLAKQEEHFDYDRFFRAYAKYYFCYEKGLSERGAALTPTTMSVSTSPISIWMSSTKPIRP